MEQRLNQNKNDELCNHISYQELSACRQKRQRQLHRQLNEGSLWIQDQDANQVQRQTESRTNSMLPMVSKSFLPKLKTEQSVQACEKTAKQEEFYQSLSNLPNIMD
jgi:hypothetical protein